MNHGKLFVRKFNINEGQHKKLTIWRCYHDEEQIRRYNMHEDGNVFLFNSKNDGYYGRNINHLNQFWCEGVCFVYPYMNNLKSDIVGFEHYRKIFNHTYDKLMLNDIKNGKIQYFYEGDSIFCTLEYRIWHHCELWRMIDCGIYDDIMEYLRKYYPKLLDLPPRNNGMICFDICALTWDKYLEMAKFLYGYIKFINDKYQLGFDEGKWAEHIYNKFIKYNRDHNVPPCEMSWGDLWGKQNWHTTPYWFNDSFKYGMYRVYSFNFEFLAACWMRYNDSVYDENNKVKFL